MPETNAYCEVLGIAVPSLAVARKSPDANFYSLLIVALLERGGPLTLEEAARRFEEAGIAPAASALASLKRCKPGRPPIYREGDLYALDPHDDETDLWVFRLGLRPPRAPALRVVRPEPGPLPAPDAPIPVDALDEALREGVPSDWSAQRVAICVLDAHGGTMPGEDVLAFVRARSPWSRLRAESSSHWRTGAPVQAHADGRWVLDRTHTAVPAAREALRRRLATVRRRAEDRPDPAVMEAHRRRYERRRQAHAEQLARMRRVLLHAFPARQPEALVLLDVEQREITTLRGREIATARERLAPYEIVAAVGVRELLRTLGFDPGARRLGELAPPQKTRTLNKRGRTLRITTPMLIEGSCHITRPLADEAVLRRHLRDGQLGKLRRRLESDAQSLFAYYQYGRLHGAVRLRWGSLDEWIPAPWVHRDEKVLGGLMQQAYEQRVPLEAVIGGAPGWREPWARAQRVYVVKEEYPGWRMGLVDEEGRVVDTGDVQAVRFGSDSP